MTYSWKVGEMTQLGLLQRHEDQSLDSPVPCTYNQVLGVGERPSDRGMNVASVHRADVCTHRDTHSICTQRQMKICILIVLVTSADCSKAELWIQFS